MIVQTEFDSKIRKRELEIQKKEEKEKDESEVKNRNFTQTYPKGWQRIKVQICVLRHDRFHIPFQCKKNKKTSPNGSELRLRRILDPPSRSPVGKPFAARGSRGWV